MDLLNGPVEHQTLKNVAAMMFGKNPAKFFPTTQVDIVIFPEGCIEITLYHDIMSSSFITNKEKFLSDIINGILPDREFGYGHDESDSKIGEKNQQHIQ